MSESYLHLIMSVDSGAEKRDDLIFQMVKERYEDEATRGEKLYEQARGLVGSILVGIGFLMTAGIIELVKVESVTSSIYLIGMGMLISSIITAFGVLRIRTYTSAVDVEHLLKGYKDRTYEYVMKTTSITMANSLLSNQNANNRKANMLMLAWYLLILGLNVILLFVVVSILTEEFVIVANPPNST